MTAHGRAAVEWGNVRQLFEHTVDLEPGMRRAALDRAATQTAPGSEASREGGAPTSNALVAAVERLLATSDTGPSPLDGCAVDLMEAEPVAAEDARGLVGSEVGGYTLRAVISSGGMGDVYRAERAVGSARRQVAVKVLKRGLDTDALLRRFRREQETLAALHHEHVVGFLDAGSLPDGRPWFVMEYVDGVPLTEACRSLDLEARVALFVSVCEAVQFAHRNLVLHRDLKPSNILVTASGTPKLLDFGVAGLLHPDGGAEHTDVTRSPTPLTPRYASPEQLRDERVAVPTDVHALGLVLYEVLVGRPARPGASLGEVLEAAKRPIPSASAALEQTSDSPFASGEHVPPVSAHRVRGDLDAIVRRAAHLEIDGRYPSAEALAVDLRLWLAGEPVSAHVGTHWERSARFLRRHRIGVGVFCALMLLLVAGFVGTWVGKQRALRDASRGWGAHAEARVAARFLEQLLVEQAALGEPLREGRQTPTRGGELAAFESPAVEARISEQLANLPESEALVRIALGRLAHASGREQTALRHLERAVELTGASIALGRRDEVRMWELLGETRVALGLVEAEGAAAALDKLRSQQ